MRQPDQYQEKKERAAAVQKEIDSVAADKMAANNGAKPAVADEENIS